MNEINENFGFKWQDSHKLTGSEFGDDVAKSTQWKPMSSLGGGFNTHCLQKVSPGRIEFKITQFARLFCLVFIVIGSINLFEGLDTLYYELRTGRSEGLFINFLAGTVFFLVGSISLFYCRARVFDYREGYFWRGSLKPKNKNQCMLVDIYAIQLLKKRTKYSSNRSNIASSGMNYINNYELNLVLKDGCRIHVVSYSSPDVTKLDANELAVFLDVPVWDVTHITIKNQ